MTIRAEAIARSLSGIRVGAGWMARCPAHRDSTPSLAIRERDGVTLWFCHAGCSQTAVLAALRALGLNVNAPARSVSQCGSRDEDGGARSRAALNLWSACRPAAGTLVSAYLASRGIEIEPPPCLRFHHALKHPSGERWPAMVAQVTRGVDAEPIGVHRTFLRRDGAGKAVVCPPKMMLGRCRGGAVRLGPTTSSLLIGEGVETSLAAMQASGRSAWAALSAPGLKTLDLPPVVEEVIILADGDASGETAAMIAATQWRREGRRVRIAQAPEGQDFNDLLLDRGEEKLVEALS